MKTNHFAVLPSQVRYDKTLADKAKLLFAEISAATNAYGICEEDNNFFAAALDIEARSVSRVLGQLVEQGHVQRFMDKGKRKLRMVTKGLPLPEGVELEPEAPKLLDVSELREMVFKMWDDGMSQIFQMIHQTSKPESYDNILRHRLATFTRDEVLKAVKNRIQYISTSDWHKENQQDAVRIESLIKDDATMLNWLNANSARQQEQTSILKAFTRDSLKQ